MSVFSNDPATADLREAYALREDPVPDMEHRRMMTGFFFWASWATVTARPGEVKSYTNNFPHEPLVGNVPTASSFMWSMFSILFMIAGIALLAWRSEEHTSELQSLMRISYAVFCLKKKHK